MRLHYQKDSVDKQVPCYHCGEHSTVPIVFDDRYFCCDGCKLVYALLKDNNLCTYYNLNASPGASHLKIKHSGSFDYLDNESIKNALLHYKEDDTEHITFYIPKIHCSSCIWLLENLHLLHAGIKSSTVNFLRKEVTIVFDSGQLKLSVVADLLAQTGYEPSINLNDQELKPDKKSTKTKIIKIGLAGFCFGNIMMLSFPEYFSSGDFLDQKQLGVVFSYLNLFLSLPVFFYCAAEFFNGAWKSIRHSHLNIDGPIALAILVTFGRSVYEIISQTGNGYLDSMSGIVFFMLIGRYFQHITYDTLSFERDYKSYFPIGVTVKTKNGTETNLPVSELKKTDRIIIHNNEIIPADAVLLSTETHIDYSFITGESAPVKKRTGELIYAGAKQMDGAIELEVVHSTSQSYLTRLWNKDQGEKQQPAHVFTDKINKYFTLVVLGIATLSASYWAMVDQAKALNAFTAVLIVACPCGLLLTATFTNGNILRILGRNKFYLKNAGVIEKLSKADTIIFDKTGTITHGSDLDFFGKKLTPYEMKLVASIAAQSTHPFSRQLYKQLNAAQLFEVRNFKSFTGKGTTALVDDNSILLGSEYFVTGKTSYYQAASQVFLSINQKVIGYFQFKNNYRIGLEQVIDSLSKKFRLILLSGDNDAERSRVEELFQHRSEVFFNQQPEEKMAYVKKKQQEGHRIIMIGDGLNDAGALMESDVGIAVSDDTNNFSPACDAILDGSVFSKIPASIELMKAGRKVIGLTFLISLTYNFIGLFFAVQGNLSPVIAAVLMPASSVSIVLLATLSTNMIARRKGL